MTNYNCKKKFNNLKRFLVEKIIKYPFLIFRGFRLTGNNKEMTRTLTAKIIITYCKNKEFSEIVINFSLKQRYWN